MSLIIKVGLVLLPLLFSLSMMMLWAMAYGLNRKEDMRGFSLNAKYSFLAFIVSLIVFLLS